MDWTITDSLLVLIVIIIVTVAYYLIGALDAQTKALHQIRDLLWQQDNPYKQLAKEMEEDRPEL